MMILLLVMLMIANEAINIPAAVVGNPLKFLFWSSEEVNCANRIAEASINSIEK